MADHPILAEARRVLVHEAGALTETAGRLDTAFVRAIEALDFCRAEGRTVHVAGLGKSGDVGRKIAATLTSTGTPAGFLHPVEAMHGDLGKVRPGDVCILISRSGTCRETVALAAALAARKVTIVAITETRNSGLGGWSDIVIRCRPGPEACPHNLAPTASTAATMAIGDALALCLAKLGEFGPDDFRATHPGGALGRTG